MDAAAVDHRSGDGGAFRDRIGVTLPAA